MGGIGDRARELGIDWDHQVGDGKEIAGFYCLCGCQQITRWSGKKWMDFRPGHDARLVAALLRKARAGEVDINEAIRCLEYAASEKLANKLRGLWLRVGRPMTPKLAALHGRKVVCTVAPHVGVEAEYDPRHKTDSQPWRIGVIRYKTNEVKIDGE